MACGQLRAGRDFNPRSPRGGATYSAEDSRNMGGTFQSTLPTRGSDGKGRQCRPKGENFNPRSPRGGATLYGAGITRANIISIHAPHEGERPYAGRRCAESNIFQSTLPTRGSD